MQELRLVAVSEDGSYAVLAVPGRGGRFALPIDDRLRIVARGQFSRLAQYEIEVESPLRPKEIQDRIRAGETAEEIADAAGVPIERVRRFEGPVLAERAYRAQEAQSATVRRPGDSGPGPRLGEVVAERLAQLGAAPEDAQWDSRKRGDGNWQVQAMFTASDQPRIAEWVFDPRRRHVFPDDDTAARLCMPETELPQIPSVPAPAPATATVTPIAARLGQAAGEGSHRAHAAARTSRDERDQAAPPARRAVGGEGGGEPAAAPRSAPVTAQGPPESDAQAPESQGRAQTSGAQGTAGPAAGADAPAAQPQQRQRPARRSGGRPRRSSVPSWDEIMFGTSRQSE